MSRRGNLMLVANYQPNPGYAWWLMEALWRQLSAIHTENGDQVFLAYPSLGPFSLEELENDAYTPVVCDLADRSLRGTLRAAVLLRKYDVVAMYFTDRSFFDVRYALFRLAGVRLIANHDHTPGDRPRRGGWIGVGKALRNRLGWFTCDLWVSLSPLMRQRALESTRIPPHKCFIVRNGIPEKPASTGAKEHIRQLFELPDDARIVASVGRAHPYKGLDFLIHAARIVCKDRPDVFFMHFGDGPALDDFKQMAANHGLGDRFKLLGNRSDVRFLLAGCDVAVHPSKGEGFSLAILEEMDAGLPVVVPDRPSVQQAIEDGKTGMVYSSDSVDAAADAIVSLLDSPEKRQMMGQRAAETVEQNYRLARTEAEFKALMRPALRRLATLKSTRDSPVRSPATGAIPRGSRHRE